MNSKLPDTAIRCSRDGDFHPQKIERIEAMESKYYCISYAYTLTCLAIAGLHGYLDTALRLIKLPRSREEAKAELQEESDRLINLFEW